MMSSCWSINSFCGVLEGNYWGLLSFSSHWDKTWSTHCMHKLHTIVWRLYIATTNKEPILAFSNITFMISFSLIPKQLHSSMELMLWCHFIEFKSTWINVFLLSKPCKIMKGNGKALIIMNGQIIFLGQKIVATTKFSALLSSKVLPKVNFRPYFCAFADL